MGDARLTSTQSFVSGGLAGIASKTVTSPLDVAKIMAQVGTKPAQQGLLGTLGNVYKREGPRGLWKGNGIACLRVFPANALQFAAFNRIKAASVDRSGQITPLAALVGGSLAGVCSAVAFYPAEMVKTRLTVDTARFKYRGIVDAFLVIAREEGFLAFYKGMAASLAGIIPVVGGTFMAYEVVDRLWDKPKWKLTPLENFVSGCLASAIIQTVSFPLDTVTKKLQAQSLTVPEDMRPDVEFKGMLDAFVQTVKKNGVVGLWRGWTACLLKGVPATGVMFATFETCRKLSLWQNGYTMNPWQDEPIPGVDQRMNPEQLKKWYAEQKDKK